MVEQVKSEVKKEEPKLFDGEFKSEEDGSKMASARDIIWATFQRVLFLDSLFYTMSN